VQTAVGKDTQTELNTLCDLQPMLSPWGWSGLEAKILASRPQRFGLGLNVVVLLCNWAFFGQKSCKIREFV